MFRISTLLISKIHKYNDLNFLNKLNNLNRNVKVSSTRAYCFTNILQKRGWSSESKNKISSLEILEDTYKRRGRIYSHNIKSVLEQSDEEWGISNCGLLLLQCCGTLLIDQDPQSRQALCEQVWKKLRELNYLSVLHYNAYIQICIQNNVYLKHKEFLQNMICEANEDTYKLLMRCVCEFGDTQNALGLLSLMKDKRLVADEHVFMSLVLGHAIQGGLKDVMPVLKTMQTAHVPVSPQIINSIIRGLVLHNNKEDFLEAFRQFSVQFSDADLIQLMMVLGQTNHHSWFDNVIQLIDPIQISKQNVDEFNLMCSRLIHMGKTEAAMLYYKKFAEPPGSLGDDNYAFFLLVDMLTSHTPVSTIIETINELKRDGLNLIALEKLTFVAVRKGLFDAAWELLTNIPNLRPHYFWPFLLHSSKDKGEIGLLNVLKKMIKMNVRPDVDTLEYYCLHLSDTTNPQHLITKLHNLGLSTREIITPLLAYLLKHIQIETACNICRSYSIEISPDRLIRPLIKSWVSTKDARRTVQILKKMSINSNDHVGQFLIRALRECKSSEDNKHFLHLLEASTKADIHISTTAVDVIINRLKHSKDTALIDQIEAAVNKLSLKTLSSNNIPHPRQMNITELENHLVELESKEMETRGVLRRLISEYCRLRNYKKAFELRNKFIASGYEESPGMKTSMMHAYVLDENIYDALKMYTSLKDLHVNFVIDEFKIVDLATALVKNRQLNEALNILQDEASIRKIQGGPQLVRNCWKLISSGHDEDEIKRLLDVLVREGYCVPNNIILGPLVKVHLKAGDLQRAVLVFKEFTEKYKCTPLQLELLSALVEYEKLELLEETLTYCSKVHGKGATSIQAIAAFAQNGLHKPLKKFLLDIKGVNRNELEKRCQRWINENMIFPLETLARAAQSLPPNIIDKDLVHYSIMRLHSINNDCEAAVNFYRDLLDAENKVSKDTSDELLRLVQRCKYKVPEELSQ